MANNYHNSRVAPPAAPMGAYNGDLYDRYADLVRFVADLQVAVGAAGKVILTGSWAAGVAADLSADVDISVVAADVAACARAIHRFAPMFCFKKFMGQNQTGALKFDGKLFDTDADLVVIHEDLAVFTEKHPHQVFSPAALERIRNAKVRLGNDYRAYSALKYQLYAACQ